MWRPCDNSWRICWVRFYHGGYHKPYPIHALWITVRIGFTMGLPKRFTCKVYPIVSYGLISPLPDGLVRTSPLQTPGQRCRSFSVTCFNLAKLLSDVFTLFINFFILYFIVIQMCTVRIWTMYGGWEWLGMVGVKHGEAKAAWMSWISGFLACWWQLQRAKPGWLSERWWMVMDGDGWWWMVMDGDGWWWMLQPLHQVKWHSIPSVASFATRVWTPSFQLCFGTDKQLGLSGPRLAPAAIGQKSLTQRLAQSSTASWFVPLGLVQRIATLTGSCSVWRPLSYHGERLTESVNLSPHQETPSDTKAVFKQCPQLADSMLALALVFRRLYVPGLPGHRSDVDICDFVVSIRVVMLRRARLVAAHSCCCQNYWFHLVYACLISRNTLLLSKLLVSLGLCVFDFTEYLCISPRMFVVVFCWTCASSTFVLHLCRHSSPSLRREPA